MKNILLSSLLGLGLIALTGCSPKKEQREAITVYAAASLTDVIQKIGESYQKDHPVDITYNFASSEALAQQLMAAPRADVYLSASQRWMNEVEKDGKVIEGTRKTLLLGQLVVVGNAASNYTMTKPEQLPSLDFAYLAVGDPASVPAGRYAKQWLESVSLPDGSTAWDAVQPRLSPTTDVRAAMAQAEARKDVLAVIYRTDYQVRADALKLVYALPVDQKPKIEYSAAVIAQGSNIDGAKTFLAYLNEPAARAIFEKYGFIMPSK